MSKIDETPDWKLGCYMEWRPKPHDETCGHCAGRGVIGGGFKDLDGPQQCPECFGRCTVTKWPKDSDKPEIPAELREHMRRAWWDYLNAAPSTRADNQTPKD